MRPLLKPRVQRVERAFTLVEFQISVVIMILVIGVCVAAHFFGLRLFQLTQSKLAASDEARAVLGNLREEIRSCAVVQVGTGDQNAFYEIADDSPQVGSALQIFPGTNTNSFILYFRSADQTVRKWSTGERQASILAHFVTNKIVFSAQDFGGNILTNNENNRVIEITLQFLQTDQKDATVKGGLHNFFQVQTKATRRKLL